MPFDARVFRVMIASPSDVSDARGIVRRSMETWNSTNSLQRRIVLFPVAWETGSAPALGDRAQAILNEQLGICDVLIGVFWTRLGTPTGISTSGTIEEIDRHVDAGSIVMLYFSNQPAVVDSVDADQLKAVKEAKTRYMKQGLVESYDELGELETKLVRGITVHLNALSDVPGFLPAPTALATPGLSDPAKSLLREAVKDKTGHVLKIASMGGSAVQTNGRNLIEGNDPREIAKWEAAVSELVESGLLEEKGYKGEVFKVTAEGYRIGDSL